MGKVDEAGRAIKQLETQLVEERRLTVARESAASQQAAGHRAAISEAAAELHAAAMAMEGGLGRVVQLEVEAAHTLQRHEAFRARTASLLVLQCHRPTLAKCYRAWRALTARSVGSKLAQAGPMPVISALRSRVLGAAVTGGVAGSMVSEYLTATLGTVEEELMQREASAEGERRRLQADLAAAEAAVAQVSAHMRTCACVSTRRRAWHARTRPAHVCVRACGTCACVRVCVRHMCMRACMALASTRGSTCVHEPARAVQRARLAMALRRAWALMPRAAHRLHTGEAGERGGPN